MALSPVFATRLNSFKSRPDLFWGDAHFKPTILNLLDRVAAVPGLTQVDLNYPDHLTGYTPAQISDALSARHLHLNGLALRYYTEPAFNQGAFTHPDPAIRQKAIDLTCEGIDALAAMGGTLMTLWLGQDGYDYAFHVDHRQVWELELEGIRRVAAHNPDIRISIEYKPKDPRAYSILPDIGTTLLAIRDLNLPNLGVTLDFAHLLYADELPAASAALVARYSRLFGVHLNDGYGRRDDGFLVGSVHLAHTLELLYVLQQIGYREAIYFDTFPDVIGIDPVAECALNIQTVLRLMALLDKVDPIEMQHLLTQQDVIGTQRLIQRLLLPDVHAQ